MIAKELLSNTIPPLKVSDNSEKAMLWMYEFHLTHLPVIEGKKYLGLISEEQILDINSIEDPLSEIITKLDRPFVNQYDFILDVVKVASDFKATVVPVVDEHENYVGLITQDHLIQAIASLSSLQSPGGYIVLEMKEIDYSLAEIARIIEGDEAKILSCYTKSNKSTDVLEVILKVSVTTLDRILASFERFEYNVKASYQESDFDDYLQDRYDSFMNYMNV